MRPLFREFSGLIALLAFLSTANPTRADIFTYIDENGEQQTVEARLAGSGQDFHALELPDGQLQVIAQAAVQKREPKADPEPLSGSEVLKTLSDQFGAELFRGHVEEPYVIGLVLAAPLPKAAEVRASSLLKKAARFMKTVEGVFLEFTRQTRLPAEKPRLPLVVLVFETDERFEQYAEEATGGRGLSAGNTAGFYNGMNNQLVIRMSECFTFEVPLHEAIHQQIHNRGLLQRLAPVPAWFNEGIATGFENNGERINIGPLKVSSRYARLAMKSNNVDWTELVRYDRALRGDVLAGEGYAQAWGMHWMLVTRYPERYTEFVKLLAAKQPLAETTPDEREAEFTRTFGKTPAELQQEFPQALEAAVRRQRVSLADGSRPGVSLTQAGLAEVEMTAVSRADQAGVLQVEGRMRNLSAIRPMTFYVSVETDSGTYADWLVPDLAPQKMAPLKQQYAQKTRPGAVGGPAKTFQVRVRAAVPDSEEAQKWLRGTLPALQR